MPSICQPLIFTSGETSGAKTCNGTQELYCVVNKKQFELKEGQKCFAALRDVSLVLNCENNILAQELYVDTKTSFIRKITDRFIWTSPSIGRFFCKGSGKCFTRFDYPTWFEVTEELSGNLYLRFDMSFNGRDIVPLNCGINYAEATVLFKIE